MKKDIEIPKVDKLSMALVYEYNDVFKTNEWNFYLINEQSKDLEVVIIVSQGFGLGKSTSLLRKTIDQLPINTAAKVEYIPDDVLSLNNRFMVSYFQDGQVFEKTFLFPANCASVENIAPLNILNGKKGLVIE